MSEIKLTTGSDVEWMELGDAFEIRKGYTPSKANAKFWADGTVPWFTLKDFTEEAGTLSDSSVKVPESAARTIFSANSILFSISATIGARALVTVPHIANDRFANLLPKEDNIDMRYALHYMDVVAKWARANASGSTFANVNAGRLKKFRFPIPSLSTQQDIANKLDAMSALINDTTAGIDAEISARQQQLDHYRSGLLSFGGTV